MLECNTYKKNINGENKRTSNEGIDLKSLKKIVIFRSLLVFFILGLILLVSAGRIKYWEGWAYILILAIPMVLFSMYLFKHDPKLLERRMRIREKQKEQKLIIKLAYPFFLAAFILPGLDKRFGWSDVPLLVKIIAFAIVLLSYLAIIYVLKTNSYASRIIEVEEGQEIITTGPYALVRHPMYLATMFFYTFSPLALGSYWAMIPAVLTVFVFIPRIRGEERELLNKLKGYKEYAQKTKYRIIPGIW